MCWAISLRGSRKNIRTILNVADLERLIDALSQV